MDPEDQIAAACIRLFDLHADGYKRPRPQARAALSPVSSATRRVHAARQVTTRSTAAF